MFTCHSLLLSGLTLAAALLPSHAAAWGAQGHRLVARIAETRLDPQAQAEANRLSVKMELQADCFAGVWGHNMQQQDILETGDLQEALNAAEAIGDDRLQQQSQGRVVPDSFTHGTSKQRYTWFKRGFDSGDPAQCNTFGSAL